MSSSLRVTLLSWLYRGYELVRWRLLRRVTVGVRILLIQQGRVLLIRHSYQNTWNVPGGGVKPGETLVQAVCREAAEEAGAIILEPPWLLGFYSNLADGRSDHVALFVSEAWQVGAASDTWEIEGLALYALDVLPPDTPSGLRRRLVDYKARRTLPLDSRALLRPW